jgi:hypothetical protein
MGIAYIVVEHFTFKKTKNKYMSYTIDKIVPVKYEWDDKWTVTANLCGLETFENCQSNYDVVDRLKKEKVLLPKTSEDSEYCQFFAYFSTKKAAENFIKRLGDYVEKRKKLISSL